MRPILDLTILLPDNWMVPVWAGYGDDGNDRLGHIHLNFNGRFIRSNLVIGDYCAAPIENGECVAPPFYKLGIDHHNLYWEVT